MAARDHALAELPEHMATGDIQAIFANLKRHVGVVALIYRHLATFPGALEGAWRIMGPMFESGVIHARAARVRNAVHDDPALRWSAFQAALRDQFGPEDLAGIGHVLDAYNRANPTNILGVLVLARVLGAPPEARAAAAPLGELAAAPVPRYPQLPPLRAIADIDRDLSQTIAGLSSSGVTGADAIVPSLYRHLAHWPAYLAEAARALRPMFVSGEIETMANQVLFEAHAEAEALFAGLEIDEPPPFDEATRLTVMESLETFVRRIPEMTVVGALLRAATPPPDNAQDGRTHT